MEAWNVRWHYTLFVVVVVLPWVRVDSLTLYIFRTKATQIFCVCVCVTRTGSWSLERKFVKLSFIYRYAFSSYFKGKWVSVFLFICFHVRTSNTYHFVVSLNQTYSVIYTVSIYESNKRRVRLKALAKKCCMVEGSM